MLERTRIVEKYDARCAFFSRMSRAHTGEVRRSLAPHEVHTDDLHSVVPFDCVPVAVDLIEGAVPLGRYVHPERAFYVFGPEDGTLGKSITSWCRDTVYVPTKFCMNLAATVNVVLYDRMNKRAKVAA